MVQLLFSVVSKLTIFCSFFNFEHLATQTFLAVHTCMYGCVCVSYSTRQSVCMCVCLFIRRKIQLTFLDTDKQAQLDGGQAHLDDGGTKKKIEK